MAPGSDKAGANGRATADGGVEAAPMHELTLIVTEGRRRRAIIDGQLTRNGSKLADGSHVRSIGRDYVVIEDMLGQPMTLRLPAPFSTTAQGLR